MKVHSGRNIYGHGPYDSEEPRLVTVSGRPGSASSKLCLVLGLQQGLKKKTTLPDKDSDSSHFSIWMSSWLAGCS